MQDLLDLGYRVDTAPIKRAEQDLDKFGRANRRVTGEIDDLGEKSERTGKQLDGFARQLKQVVSVYAAFAALRAITRIADEYTKFTAQLKLATDSQEQFTAAYSDVVAIARSSQSDIGGLGTLYARITNATREMGLAQSDVAKISETVALSLRVSGATAAESASAMLQLSQAFGSGVLRGEEFNAVNEAAPGLMRALAESIGAPVGALREMASNGELTSDVLARAFKDDELLARLREQAKEVQTVSSAVVALKNELTIFIGELDKTTGASKGLAQAIGGLAEFIGENQDGIITFFGTMSSGAVIGGLGLAAANIGKVTVAVEALSIAALAAAKNPVVLAIFGLASLATAAAYAEQQTANIEKTLTAQTKIAELSAKIAASEKFIAESRQAGGNRLAGIAEQTNLNKLYDEYNALILENAGLERDYQTEWYADKTKQTALQKTFSDAAYEGIMLEFEAKEKLEKLNKDGNKEQEKALREYLVRMKELAGATKDVEDERAKQVKTEAATTDELRDQVKAVREQIAQFNKSERETRELERANLDFAESVIEMRKAIAGMSGGNAQLIAEYDEQLQKIRDLKVEQDALYELQDTDKYRQAAEALEAANREIADTFKDDLLDSIKSAFLQGGSFGEAFARGLKAELIEAFLDPALGDAIARAKGGDFGSLGNIISGASTAGAAGGVLGALLSSGNQLASKLVSITGATGQTSAAMLQIGNNLSKIAPYAGSIAALIQGDIKGAAGAALGTYIGNILLPGIGGAVGGFLGGLVGGGGKISATSLGAQFGQDLTNTLQDSFLSSVASLGGTAANVIFGAGGNTGRQGQNPNFTLGASFGGRSIFGSAQTAEGQADGLFLSGEIALNEKNLTEQVARAVFAGLQQSEFAQNIEDVISGINAATANFEELNAALTDAQLLAQINKAFADVEGALGTLSGASRDTVVDLLALVGGLDGLMAGSNAFYQAFYTEQERAADQLNAVTQAFANFGEPLPRTRLELRQLVDGLDLQNEADRRLYATILQLTPALDELLPAFDNVSGAVDNLTISLLGLAQQITSEAQKAIESQIDLSRKAADQARDAARSYFNLRDSLTGVGAGLLGTLIGPQAQFGQLFAKAITGDISALSGLGGAAQAEAQRIRNTASDPVAYMRQTLLLKQQIDQAAAVADVLGAGADYQAQLFDVQTAALEVIRDQLEAGNLTADLLTEQIGVLQNIGTLIANSAQLTVTATQNAAGQTVGALIDTSGNVVAKLNNDTVLQIQALQNQTNANAQQNNALGQQVTSGFSNSLTGQTATLGNLTQQQIRELQGLDDTQTENLGIAEIISRATEGSETLLLAVLGKLSQQDSSGLAIVDALQDGNDKISGYLFRLVNIAEKQEAEQIRLETIANLNKEAQAAKAQITQAQTIRSQTTGDLAKLQQQAYGLASQFGVFLNEKAGAVQLSNTAKFGVNSQTGLYQQLFGQISFGNGGNPQAFKSEFYKPGGLFDQIQAEAAQLAQAAQLLNPANQQLAGLRQQIIDLGGVPEFANGGIVNSATLAMIGEGRYNEAVVPLPDGSSIPVQMMGKDNKELVAEMRALRNEVQMLRRETQQVAVNTGRTERMIDDVTQGGTEIRTVVVTP